MQHLLAIYVGLEVPAHKLAKFSGQLRLSRLKQLARSMNDPLINNHKVAVDVTIKMNESSSKFIDIELMIIYVVSSLIFDSYSGVSPKGLRLNRVKHLARSLNSTIKETAGQNRQAK